MKGFVELKSYFRKMFLLIPVLAFVLSANFSLFPITNAQESDKPIFKPTGNEGSITGKVNFEGPPLSRQRIDMSQDANCASIYPKPELTNVIITKSMIANVLVYVKNGEALNTFAFETPSAIATLDQKLCQFVPRVLGIQTNQTLIIFNSDPTTHNIHPLPKYNPEWNKVQPAGGKPFEESFKKPELFIRVKCNQHPWMEAYINVFSHPFFAVTAKDGTFKIEGLPPGTYTLAAWHEVFEEQTMEIIINPNEAKTLSFGFAKSIKTNTK